MTNLFKLADYGRPFRESYNSPTSEPTNISTNSAGISTGPTTQSGRKASPKRNQRPNTKVAGFRYLKTKNIYRRSNNEFYADDCQAYSCGWYRYIDRIDGYVIFNAYRYSTSTDKHLLHGWDLLEELGIDIAETVYCPGGLQDLESGIRHAEEQIANLNAAVRKKGSRYKTNEKRIEQIKVWQNQIDILNNLINLERTENNV